MIDDPSFEEAISRLSAFASSQGAPGKLLFVEPQDVVVASGVVAVHSHRPRDRDECAKEAYRRGVGKGLGILLHGFCACKGHLCSFVYVPSTLDESINHLMADGLKLSVSTPLRRGFFAGRLHWSILKFRETMNPRLTTEKAILFGRDVEAAQQALHPSAPREGSGDSTRR